MLLNTVFFFINFIYLLGTKILQNSTINFIAIKFTTFSGGT